MASLEIAEDKEVKLLEVFEFTVPSLQFCSPLCIRLRHFFSPSHYFLFHLLSLLPDPPPLFPPVIRYLLLLDIFLSQVGINVWQTNHLISDKDDVFCLQKGNKGKGRERIRKSCLLSFHFLFLSCHNTVPLLWQGLHKQHLVRVRQ